MFPSPKQSIQALGTTQPRIQWVQGFFSPGVRLQRPEAHFRLVTKFKMCGVRPPPTYSFMACTGTLIIIIIIIIIQCLLIMCWHNSGNTGVMGANSFRIVNVLRLCLLVLCV
jgi:hypothetical protein